MINLSPAAEQNINDAFAAKLKTLDPKLLHVLIEVQPGEAQNVVSELTGLNGVKVNTSNVVAGQFIPAVVPKGQINAVAQLPGVKTVSEDQIVTVGNTPKNTPEFKTPVPITNLDFPWLTTTKDPFRQKLSDFIYQQFEPKNDFGERVGLSKVEVPRINFAQLPPGDPLQTAFAATGQLFNAVTGTGKFIPVSKTREWMLNGSATDGHEGGGVKAAVCDTGLFPAPLAIGARAPKTKSFVPGEPWVDGLGHGSWVSYTLSGKKVPSVWGECQGLAPNDEMGMFKCLNTFPGFGRTSWILKSMEAAVIWGADVVNLSLGGTQQGPLDQDPYAAFIRRFCKENAGDKDGAIFVCASGNSGPGAWSVGSPGVSEKALTVASVSMLDQAPAYWSSRGPQGKWYKNHQSKFESDHQKYGTLEFIKPDLAAPGGGRETKKKANAEDELLCGVEEGWMEGLYDGIKGDLRGMLHGTSQATPAAAGMVVRLYQAGIIETAKDVKEMLKQNQTVSDFPTAAKNANGSVASKSISVGFGNLRESVF